MPIHPSACCASLSTSQVSILSRVAFPSLDPPRGQATITFGATSPSRCHLQARSTAHSYHASIHLEDTANLHHGDPPRRRGFQAVRSGKFNSSMVPFSFKTWQPNPILVAVAVAVDAIRHCPSLSLFRPVVSCFLSPVRSMSQTPISLPTAVPCSCAGYKQYMYLASSPSSFPVTSHSRCTCWVC